jgi:NAD(P)-dependent dehydrogenase (short-subunit alcohol dehydrogenase family)
LNHAFVAGATGFVGRALVHTLCRGGWQVTAHVRPDSRQLETFRAEFLGRGAKVSAVAWEPQDREFNGRAILETQRQKGPNQVQIGLVLLDKGVLRPHQRVEAPGLGDEIQAIKAGLFEIADIFVVNKADRSGADAAVAALKSMLGLSEGLTTDGWRPPVIKTIATQGEGIPDLIQALEAHWAYLQGSGERELRDRRRSEEELRRAVSAELLERTLARIDVRRWGQLVDQIAQRQIDPYTAAGRLLESTPTVEQ